MRTMTSVDDGTLETYLPQTTPTEVSYELESETAPVRATRRPSTETEDLQEPWLGSLGGGEGGEGTYNGGDGNGGAGGDDPTAP